MGFSRVAFLTIAACVLLNACSTEPTPTPTPTLPLLTPTPAALPTSAQAPEGTLRVAVVGAAPHQDLHRVVSEWATLFGSGLGYNRLFRFVAYPETELPSLQVECDLCLEWTFIDATTLEVELHPHAWWQNADNFMSRPITPQDILWSLERLRQPDSPHQYLLDSVDNIDIVGDRIVRFTLHYPDADLLLKLASPYAVIMAPDSLDAVNLRTGRVLGAGAWRYVRGGTGQVTLTAWEDYFRDAEPTASVVKFLPVAKLDTGVVLLDLDRVDIAQVTEPQWAAMDHERYDSVVVDRQGRGVLFGINGGREPLKDHRVRRAIFGSLDPEAAMNESFGIGWIGLGMPLVDPSWSIDEALLSPFADVPFAVRNSLGNVPLTLTVGNFGEAYIAHGEAMAAQLRDNGFAIVVEVVSRGAYLERVWQQRDYDLFVGPTPPTDTPNGFMLALFHSRGASNVTDAGSPELDHLIETFTAELDPSKRAELAVRVQTRALDGAWMFMAAGLSERWAFNDRVVYPPQAFPQGSGDGWKYVGVREPL